MIVLFSAYFIHGYIYSPGTGAYIQLCHPIYQRSDYVTRTWHGVTEVFDSPTTIQQKLEEFF